MQAFVGWIVVALIVLGVWQLRRALRRSLRGMQQARAEAFSNAVSEAVASGVATALAAAQADARAAATGGSVQLHIGDNLARLLANDNYGSNHDDDDGSAHDNYNRVAALRESADRRGVVSLPDNARRREHTSGRTDAGSPARGARGSDLRSGSADRESLER